MVEMSYRSGRNELLAFWEIFQLLSTVDWSAESLNFYFNESVEFFGGWRNWVPLWRDLIVWWMSRCIYVWVQEGRGRERRAPGGGVAERSSYFGFMGTLNNPERESYARWSNVSIRFLSPHSTHFYPLSLGGFYWENSPASKHTGDVIYLLLLLRLPCYLRENLIFSFHKICRMNDSILILREWPSSRGMRIPLARIMMSDFNQSISISP